MVADATENKSQTPRARTGHRSPYRKKGDRDLTLLEGHIRLRAAHEASMRQLTGNEFKVFCFILDKTIGYSRWWDYIYRDAVIEATGVHRRHLGPLVKRLDDLGFVVYTPGTGRSPSSFQVVESVTIPVDPEERVRLADASRRSPQGGEAGDTKTVPPEDTETVPPSRRGEEPKSPKTVSPQSSRGHRNCAPSNEERSENCVPSMTGGDTVFVSRTREGVTTREETQAEEGNEGGGNSRARGRVGVRAAGRNGGREKPPPETRPSSGQSVGGAAVERVGTRASALEERRVSGWGAVSADVVVDVFAGVVGLRVTPVSHRVLVRGVEELLGAGFGVGEVLVGLGFWWEEGFRLVRQVPEMAERAAGLGSVNTGVVASDLVAEGRRRVSAWVGARGAAQAVSGRKARKVATEDALTGWATQRKREIAEAAAEAKGRGTR